MLSEAELIVDRRKLKRRVTFWRVAAVLLALASVFAMVWASGAFKIYGDHVARIRIDGLITGDQATLSLLDEVAASNAAKAVILRIDSPGGTTAGSEAIYEKLRAIAKDKPLVAVMDTVAASGGYITAIAADRIVARGNTITGSIGVIFTFPEISRLLDTIGVRMEEIKSGELKAEPSPYRPVSDKARQISNEMVQDSFAWFVGLVAERRNLPLTRVRELSDGRVYTGRQALAVKLVDEIGGEAEALSWLQGQKGVAAGLEIVDWTGKSNLDPGGLGFSGRSLAKVLGLERLVKAAERVQLDGLLVLWHPEL